MMRAKDGALWFALNVAKILRWDGKAWTVFGTQEGVQAKEIYRLLEDSNGGIWAAAGEGGLLRFKPDTGGWQRVEFQRADAPVYWVGEVDKSIWASGDNFIARSDDGGQRWSLVATPQDGLAYPTKVVKDKAGRIWAGTSQGVATYEDGQWRRWQRPGEPSWYAMGQIAADSGGKLWVRPEYGGDPSVIDPATGELTAPPQWPQEQPDVISLAFEGDTTVWAGTTAGLLRLEGGKQRLLTTADGLPDNQITAMVTTPGTLWIGTHAGLVTLDLATGKVSDPVAAVADHYVSRLLAAPDGAVWAGTYWGADAENSAVVRLAGNDHQTWQSPEAPLTGDKDWVNALAADDTGGIWVASDSGVHRWDGKTWEGWNSTLGGPSSEIFALLPAGGAMWAAGHSNMIDRWDARGGWQHFRPKGLSGDVLDMHTSADGALWLATQDGVLRYGP